MTKSNTQSGQLSIAMLILGLTGSVLLGGFVLWVDTYVRNTGREGNANLAFTIAESGIEYYRWHLAHAPQDFQDGTATSGPYVHDYYDKDGNKIGEFELAITPPATGTTIVIIQSTGRVDADPGISKIIRVRMGLPSFARFSVAANADIRFGAGTQVYGQLHSNGGIRFDGIAYNIVTSARSDYNDPDHTGSNEFGVHTHVSPTDPLPPLPVPVRTDVFTAGRQFPVPAIDFTGITQDLATIRTNASTSGFYRGPSGARGYDLILKTDDTFDLYRVDTVVSPTSSQCNNALGQDGWGLWSVRTRTFLTSSTIPANGLIFLEDDAWVSGQINTARVTIATGRFPVNPTTYASITTNNDLLYTNYDGQDVISLMTQKNVNVGLKSEDDLKVDAALVAQNGRVGRYYYVSQCGTEYIRTTISSFGMVASNQRYGWAYTNGTGYQNRILTYDGNLLYGPPPSFPITASQYDIISWEEIK